MTKSLNLLQTIGNIRELPSILRDDQTTAEVRVLPVPAGPRGDGPQDGGVQLGRGERPAVWRPLSVTGGLSHSHMS